MSLLHPKYCADQATQISTEIIENVRVAKDTQRVRMTAPQIARRFVPGQFVMLRLAGWNDPLIGRPLAVYDSGGEPGREWIDLVYLVKGKFTAQLARCGAGVPLEVWGPLGNGFAPPSAGRLIMVAGGIGQTPFLSLAQEALGKRPFGGAERASVRPEKVLFCYGARTADYFAGLDDFARLGVDLRLATNDGSRGRKGLVTDLLRELLEDSSLPTRVVCCGPESMMEAVSEICLHAGVPCEVSLETPMACGVGICFTCVAKIRQPDGTWDYKRTCVDGPIFPAAAIAW